MPALLPASKIARCVFRGTANATNIVNVFHISKDQTDVGGFSQAEIDALANAIAPIWTARLMPQLGAAYAAKEVVCTDLTSNFGVVGVKTMTGTGTGSSTNVPNSTCACITWKIAKHYRGGHPRTYLGPPATASISTGTTLAASFVTALTTGAQGFLADVNALSVAGSPYALVALHRTENSAQLNPPEFSPITGAVVDDRIDTQRRRLGKDR